MADETPPREAMEFDVVIVGAGPAGLAAAIRLKQLSPDTRGLSWSKKPAKSAATSCPARCSSRARSNELIPDWKDKGAPLATPAREDRFLFLTETRAIRLPTPPQMHNHGNYIVSLGNVVRWLASRPRSSASKSTPVSPPPNCWRRRPNRRHRHRRHGHRQGRPAHRQLRRGMELRANYTLFAEGCRGSLSKQLMQRFNLRDGHDPQTYAIGIKELWEIPAAQPQAGPDRAHARLAARHATYGGSFLYHFGNNLVSYGFVIGLDYRNPWLSPFEEMQRFKTHPAMRKHFEGGRRISYGARALNEGGLQSLPRLTFPGGAADRRRGRLPQRAEDQGHPHRDEVRHAGRRSGRRGAGRRAARRTGRLRAEAPPSWVCEELTKGPQRPAGVRQIRPLGRSA